MRPRTCCASTQASIIPVRKSYSEIAGESRSQHKSQGFGSAGRRGTQPDYFEVAAGEPATQDIFDGLDVTWDRVPADKKRGGSWQRAWSLLTRGSPPNPLPVLLGVYAELANSLMGLGPGQKGRAAARHPGVWRNLDGGDSRRLCGGPGDTIQIRTSVINRSDHPLTLHGLGFPGISEESVLDRPSRTTSPNPAKRRSVFPKTFPFRSRIGLRSRIGKDSLRP